MGGEQSKELKRPETLKIQIVPSGSVQPTTKSENSTGTRLTSFTANSSNENDGTTGHTNLATKPSPERSVDIFLGPLSPDGASVRNAPVRNTNAKAPARLSEHTSFDAPKKLLSLNDDDDANDDISHFVDDVDDLEDEEEQPSSKWWQCCCMKPKVPPAPKKNEAKNEALRQKILRDSGISRLTSISRNVNSRRSIGSTRMSKTRDSYKIRESVDTRGRHRINEYILAEEIGYGSYGKVFRVLDTENRNEIFAMKILDFKALKRANTLKLSRRKKNRDDLALLKRELAIMRLMDHPNLIVLHQVIETQEKICYVMDYINGGTLTDSEVKTKPYSEYDCRYFFRQLLQALDYLHKNNVVHGDIKPENILKDEFKTIKVADFGSAVLVNPARPYLDKATGTAAFMPPECCNLDGPASPKSPSNALHKASRQARLKYQGKLADIWSTGVTLFVLAFGQLPFNKANSYLMYRAIQHEDIELPPNNNVKPELKNLLALMLEKNPVERITLEELWEHPWVTENGKDPMPDPIVAHDYYCRLCFRPFVEGTICGLDAYCTPASVPKSKALANKRSSTSARASIDRLSSISQQGSHESLSTLHIWR